MEEFELNIGEKGTLAGTAIGEGDRLLICWHGYGQDRRLFQFLPELRPQGCRLILLDMPPFGKSMWPEEAPPLQPDDLAQALEALLTRYPAQRVEMLAFSLGAKLALGLYQATGRTIHRMVLLSPDGLRIHPIYRFCIYNPLGKAIFYTILRWPGAFLFLLKALYHLRITDPFKYRFVQQQFAAPHRRTLLRRVWRGNASIRPDTDAIAAKSTAQQTEWHVIWGEGDNILPMDLCRDFIGKVNGARLHVVEGGHFLLNPPRQDVVQLLKTVLEL